MTYDLHDVIRKQVPGTDLREQQHNQETVYRCEQLYAPIGQHQNVLWKMLNSLKTSDT